MPRTEATTGTSSSAAPSGPAGGDLTGTYPDPTIGAGKVTSAKIADDTIVNGDINSSAAIAYSKLNLANSIVSGDIVAGTVANSDLADMAAKTVKMRHTNSTGAPEDTTMANLWTDLSGQAGASVAMNGQKFTGLAAGSAAGESVRYEQAAPGLLTAKGGLISATAANTPAMLAVGANSQVLMADSAASTGNKWFGGAWSSTFDVVNTSAVTSFFSQSVPANTLGTNGAVFVTVNGFYLNNSGASRGLRFQISLGVTALWDDTTSSTYFGATATAYPFYMQFLLANDGATNAQRMSGFIRIGQATAASSAVGVGSLSQSGDVSSTPFHGTAAIDTTSAATLAVKVAHSTNNSSLQLRGTTHAWVVV